MRQLVIILFILLLAVCAVAQTAQSAQIQKVPAKYTAPSSGKDMFESYCASCHGKDGTGNGPAASAMKKAVPDLTMLSKSHNGLFPAFQVMQVIRGDNMIAAHGSNDMPVWGPVFSRLSQQREGEIQQRLHNLTTYIESLQKK